MALNINNELFYILIEEQLNKNEAELIKYYIIFILIILYINRKINLLLK